MLKNADPRIRRTDFQSVHHTHSNKRRAWARKNMPALPVPDAECGEVRLWNPRTGRQRGPVLKVDFAVRSVAFSPDGKTVIAAGGPERWRSGT